MVKQTSISIQAPLLEKLDAAAKATGVSRSAYISFCIARMVNENAKSS